MACTEVFYWFYQVYLKEASWVLYYSWCTSLTYFQLFIVLMPSLLLMIQNAISLSYNYLIPSNYNKTLIPYQIGQGTGISSSLILASSFINLSIQNFLHASYYIGGKLITTNITHQDLKIILSTNFSWRDHYKHISAKAYKTLSLLRHTFCHTVNILTKKSLYLS